MLSWRPRHNKILRGRSASGGPRLAQHYGDWPGSLPSRARAPLSQEGCKDTGRAVSDKEATARQGAEVMVVPGRRLEG